MHVKNLFTQQLTTPVMVHLQTHLHTHLHKPIVSLQLVKLQYRLQLFVSLVDRKYHIYRVPVLGRLGGIQNCKWEKSLSWPFVSAGTIEWRVSGPAHSNNSMFSLSLALSFVLGKNGLDNTYFQMDVSKFILCCILKE